MFKNNFSGTKFYFATHDCYLIINKNLSLVLAYITEIDIFTPKIVKLVWKFSEYFTFINANTHIYARFEPATPGVGDKSACLAPTPPSRMKNLLQR